MYTYGVTRSIVNRIPDYDVEEAKLATAGLLVTGEGKRVMAGLTCLAERHSDNVMFDIIKTSPWTATIVISSHQGEWNDRSAEVQVHLASDHREVPLPTIHVSGSDNQVHSYKIDPVRARGPGYPGGLLEMGGGLLRPGGPRGGPRQQRVHRTG